MPEPKYRWRSPYEWLAEKAGEWNIQTLHNEFLALAERVDSDTLQDLYQTEMEQDGYFKPIKEA